MAFSHSPLSGSPLVGAYGVNQAWEEWKYTDFSVYTGFDDNLKNMMSTPMTISDSIISERSSYYCDSTTSDPSSPTSMPSTPVSPVTPGLPKFHQKSVTSTPQSSTKPKVQKEDLTPKQLKRRLQNRVSQQAVRRRRNSPARILETRLQELDRQQSSLMQLYANNIDSCISTLAAEIETLKELKVLLTSGSVVPARFNSLLLKSGGPMGSMGLGIIGENGVGAVRQSAAYQNHDFDSSIMGSSRF